MTRISKLALVAVAAMGVASPVLAQSSQHRIGIHKVYRHTVVARQSGFNAFAMVPGGAGSSAFSPAANGGGSVGYNENLRRDQW
jgi:hypothetical protein